MPGRGNESMSRGTNAAEDLDDGEEGCEAGGGDGAKELDCAGGGVTVFGQQALELEQALAAIDAIPMVNAIEWIEERLVVNNRRFSRAQLAMVIQSIERAHGETVQQGRGHFDGYREMRLAGWHELFGA